MIEKTFVWKDTKRAPFGLAWTFTKYTLTDEKLLIKTGLFNQKEEEVRLYRILDITLNQSLEERLWGLGTSTAARQINRPQSLILSV